MHRFLPLAVFVLAATALVLSLRPAPDRARRGAPTPELEERPSDAPDVPVPAVDPEGCRDAAYLCVGLLEREQMLVARWPDGTRELRVRVTRPDHEDPVQADELQRAAARGIRVWQGQPFPLRIETDERPGRPDVEVRWAAALNGTELGRVSTTWSGSAGTETFQVREFVLATRVPGRPDERLSPLEVERAAAHEMGHALGLPHSPDPTHLMFPDNRSTGLSVDDYRAVEALYRMPPGARLPASR